jgi:hypothetical protein
LRYLRFLFLISNARKQDNNQQNTTDENYDEIRYVPIRFLSSPNINSLSTIIPEMGNINVFKNKE